MYLVEFDPLSVARLNMLMAMDPVYDKFLLAAMAASVAAVVRETSSRAPVGTRASGGFSGGGHGTLRRGIRPGIITPELGTVGMLASIPYALRREKGYTGMWDTHRTGGQVGQKWRFYNSDPGAFYMRDGFEAALPFIAAAFEIANTLAIRVVADL